MQVADISLSPLLQGLSTPLPALYHICKYFPCTFADISLAHPACCKYFPCTLQICTYFVWDKDYLCILRNISHISYFHTAHICLDRWKYFPYLIFSLHLHTVHIAYCFGALTICTVYTHESTTRHFGQTKHPRYRPSALTIHCCGIPKNEHSDLKTETVRSSQCDT